MREGLECAHHTRQLIFSNWHCKLRICASFLLAVAGGASAAGGSGYVIRQGRCASRARGRCGDARVDGLASPLARTPRVSKEIGTAGAALRRSVLGMTVWTSRSRPRGPASPAHCLARWPAPGTRGDGPERGDSQRMKDG